MKIKKPPHPLAPPDEGKKTTTISLTYSTHAKVKQVALWERRSFSAQAELMIESALKETP
jgi:hypothetical protein